MNRTRIIIIAAFLAFTFKSLAVTVGTTSNLKVYYPEFTRIDLVCGQMPKPAQKDVEFCCESAFTGELLGVFRHSNIADNHICNGVMKKGYRCGLNIKSESSSFINAVAGIGCQSPMDVCDSVWTYEREECKEIKTLKK